MLLGCIELCISYYCYVAVNGPAYVAIELCVSHYCYAPAYVAIGQTVRSIQRAGGVISGRC